MFEVEQKFPVDRVDTVVAQLASHGVVLGPPVEQVDRYFAHPARDFATTDEALRTRRVGDANRITYKGPKIDRIVKTRRELELPLPDGAEYEPQFAQLLDALGFRQVAIVRKQRRSGQLTRHGRTLEVVLDEVDELGPFVEIETLATSDSLEAAREVILATAAEFGLHEPERRSYLEMILGLAKK